MSATFAPSNPPLPIKPGPLNHIALPTADPERGARFFCDVLGFTATARPSFTFRGAWLLHPDVGVMIHLIYDERHDPNLSEPINTRTSHLAIETAHYDRACRQLAEHGVEYVERVLPDYGYRQVFFRDPDGNVLELGEWPSAAVMFPAEFRAAKT